MTWILGIARMIWTSRVGRYVSLIFLLGALAVGAYQYLTYTIEQDVRREVHREVQSEKRQAEKETRDRVDEGVSDSPDGVSDALRLLRDRQDRD